MRTVVETESFVRSREEIEPEVERWDAAFSGFLFVVARTPEVGARIDTTPIYVLELDDWISHLPLDIYYMFDETTVTLLALMPRRVEE